MNIERQARNISMPTLFGKPSPYHDWLEGMEQGIQGCHAGDAVIFDSVSCMSHNAEEGFAAI